MERAFLVPAMAPFRHLTAKDVPIPEHSKTFSKFFKCACVQRLFPSYLEIRQTASSGWLRLSPFLGVFLRLLKQRL